MSSSMQLKNKYLPIIQAYILRLNDVRFVGQLVFVVLVLLISWSGVKSIQTNYSLQKQAADLRQQNAVQQLQNTNAALENEYYNSNQYLELSARQDFGLAEPNEKEVIVPASVALSYTSPLPSLASTKAINQLQPKTQRNFQSWINFFLHRQSD